MKKNNLSGKTIFGKQLMATVSVMIVLLILGLFAAFAIGAGQFSKSLKSRMGFTIVMNDDVSEKTLESMQKMLSSAPFVGSVTFTSADEALANWEKENGEDIMAVLGANPFGAQYEITVTSDYALSDSLETIKTRIGGIQGVDEVSTTTEVVDVINRLVNIITMISLALAMALLLVSGVLITNTIRLTVYSSRFLIHTMKLVGATGAFIRRPFIRTGIINGVVAGVIASVILALIIAGIHSASADIAAFTSWASMSWVFPAMVLLGVAICGIAAALATNKYLRLGYDEMF
ncbi:MAG: permease-like cell division protein FtsX [Muribaculaceae bacterium]|nr:permease-like cell division protein FtsX [Muribaculaceae bacterium]